MIGGMAQLTVARGESPQAPENWIGCLHADVAASEMSAMHWALEWAARAWPLTPAEIHYDSEAAANAATGAAGVAGHDLQVSVLRQRYRESMTALKAPGMHHVHGHTGEPWN